MSAVRLGQIDKPTDCPISELFGVGISCTFISEGIIEQIVHLRISRVYLEVVSAFLMDFSWAVILTILRGRIRRVGCRKAAYTFSNDRCCGRAESGSILRERWLL